MKPGFKVTELGLVPEDWDVKRLSDIVSTPITDGPHLTPVFRSDGVPFLSVNNLVDNRLDLTSLRFISRDDHEVFARKCRPQRGDILFGKAASVGQVALIETDIELNIWSPLALIRVGHNASPRFVHIALQTRDVHKQIALLTNASSQGNIGMSDIGRIVVPVPGVAEQAAIETAISDVDELLRGLDHLITKKLELKRAAIQQLLTGKTRLAGFNGAWEEKRLGELGVFLQGSGVKKDEARSGELPCIRYGEIYTHHDDYIKAFNSWISRAVADTATALHYGDILFAGSGETRSEIGKCVAFVDHLEAYAGGDIIILRPTGCHSLFLGYLLNTPILASEKARRGQGDAVAHISASALASIRVLLPNVDEQAAIAAVLFDMDAELLALERRHEKTRAIRQAMMQELLTGRARLI